jgi:acyl-CoA thioesterase-1
VPFVFYSKVLRYSSILFIGLLVVAGCGRDQPATAGGSTDPAPAAPVSAPSSRPRVVFLGDSLTAGLGLPADEAFPAVIQRRIDEEHLGYDVINAGVSGDTTAGGLRRVDWVLSGDVRVLVIALGGNDGLRGLPPGEMKQNLSRIVERARNRGIEVVLAGMEAPPNVGPEYTSAFRNVYREIAQEQRVPLIPFLLRGVAGESALNQADGIHPNEEGARRVAAVVWPALRPLLVRQ